MNETAKHGPTAPKRYYNPTPLELLQQQYPEPATPEPATPTSLEDLFVMIAVALKYWPDPDKPGLDIAAKFATIREAMIVNGFIDDLVRKLPLEYAIEMNRLIDYEMEGSIG
jgi:hypothetical protein